MRNEKWIACFAEVERKIESKKKKKIVKTHSGTRTLDIFAAPVSMRTAHHFHGFEIVWKIYDYIVKAYLHCTIP